jgi:hypothetical protein
MGTSVMTERRRIEVEVDPFTERVTRTWCGECGMELRGPGDYHPIQFCVLHKAGFNPWTVIADARRLARG